MGLCCHRWWWSAKGLVMVAMVMAMRCPLWVQRRRDVGCSGVRRQCRTLAVRGSGLAGGWIKIAVVADYKVNGNLIRVAELHKEELVSLP